MVGARTEDEQLLYPVSDLAGRYGASAEKETPDSAAGIRAVRAASSGEALVLASAPLGLISR